MFNICSLSVLELSCDIDAFKSVSIAEFDSNGVILKDVSIRFLRRELSFGFSSELKTSWSE
jgi:hypothetical protein